MKLTLSEAPKTVFFSGHKCIISNNAYNQCFRRKNAGLRWLSNVNCSGQESYFGRCGNIRWGSIQSCADDVDAAAYCYQKSGNISVQIIVSCNLLLTSHANITTVSDFKYILKKVSFGSKERIKEMKLECAYFLGRLASFGHLGLISNPLIIIFLASNCNYKF